MSRPVANAEQPLRRLARLSEHVLAASSCASSQASASPDAAGRGPLSGIRVVELATVVAAPTACALLCDMGAEVIKIEAPKDPDISRSWGGGDEPDKTAMPELQQKEQGGSAFVQFNRGKRSIAIDVATPSGKAILKRMLAGADVFVTNVRLQSLRKNGLDYEALAPEFPRLIYGHLSAYGRTGPQVNDPGYDFGAYWSRTGLKDLCRSSEGAAMPRFPGAIGDNSTAVQFAGFIGIALFHRERTGRGQLVDAALFRSGIQSIAHPIASLAGGNQWATMTGDFGGIREPTDKGKRRTLVSDADFQCKDGEWVQLLGLDLRKHFPKLLKATGIDASKIFGSREKKKAGVPTDWRAATAAMDEVIATKSYAEWHKIFQEHDVWHVRVHRFEEMLEDEQALQSGIFVDAPGVRHRLVGSPVLLSDSKAQPRAGAPALGEHTAAVLREHGYTAEDEKKLRQEGIVK